ncbi:hypothetical protein YC2023_009571 [Brassica napus]
MMVDLITLADLFYVGRLLVADFIPMIAGFVICRKFCTGMQIYLKLMERVIAVCGQWLFEKDKWMFHVDNRIGSKVIPISDKTSFEDMINMVYEDYGLDKRHVNIDPKPIKILQTRNLIIDLSS